MTERGENLSEPKAQKVVIIMGSKSDLDHAAEITAELTGLGVDFEKHIASAHKNPEYLLKLLQTLKQRDVQIVYITIAGRTDALSGVVAGDVNTPVISCPPASDKFAGLDILSSLRSPSGIPNMLVVEPVNAALAAATILALNNPTLANSLLERKKKVRDAVYSAETSLISARDTDIFPAAIHE